MKIVNIYNQQREIKLFCRDEKGNLDIKIVKDFFPYFYEKSIDGTFKSFKGEPLRKMFMSVPSDVPKQRSNEAFEADILFTKRYLIDKVTTLDKCPIKFAFIDIEVQSDELPNVQLVEKPVSCITVYNSFSKEYKSFYLPNYPTEYEMLEDFMKYMREEKFDLWLSWYVGFDYNYLYNRIPDFAQKISPIGKSRYGDGEIYYPAGISIIDYLGWFKKVTLNKEKRYTLDYIAEKHLGKGKEFSKVDFSKISEEIKNRNREDVEIMVKLEEKFKLISYYDEIRRLSKVEWEDLIWNSRVLDMLLLQEAKNQNIVLPMKPSEDRNTLADKPDFKGAYRHLFESGAHFDVKSYDISSAYPSMISNFCLDPSNLKEEKTQKTLPITIYNIKRDKKTKEIIHENNKSLALEIGNKYYFEQNKNSLLPTVVNKLLNLKKDIKNKLSKLTLDTEEYKNKKTFYDAIKTVVNSTYGVFGNRFFRLFNTPIAESTTFLVRDFLDYIITNLTLQGYNIIYVDTDGMMISNCKENILNLIDKLAKQWAKEKHNKENLSLEFEYEGNYEKLLLLAKCRYKGYKRTKKGLEEITCGIESKRKDSTIFMVKFQTELIDKILDKEPKKKIMTWIKGQVKEVKKAPVANIAFPCKLARKPSEYKNVPIFLRALNCTPKFSKKVGNAFYYIYMKPFGHEYKEEEVLFMNGKKLTSSKLKEPWKEFYGEDILVKNMDDERKEKLMTHLIEKGALVKEIIKVKGKVKNVMAFDDDEFAHINREDICWDTMIKRNIYMKLITIFEAMKWDMGEVLE